MRLFVQACILGLLTGGVYALMASGLTLAFGIMRVINVAQGAMIVLGSYLSYTAFTRFHIDPLASILLITPILFLVGVGVQLAFLRPLRREDRESLSLLVTWAIALGVEGLLGLFYNNNYRSIITGYSDSSWRILGYSISEVRVFAFAISMSILAALFLLLRWTRFGRAVRGTVQNPVSAALLGVDSNRISALGFGISIATAGAAGAVFGMIFPFDPGSHYDLISRLLTIVVLGGMGSLGGAVVAALFMGVAQSVLEAGVVPFIPPAWSSFVFFVALIAILVIRPQGLFGTVERGSL
jgi:branched-chain amino acid transport system permease protein